MRNNIVTIITSTALIAIQLAVPAMPMGSPGMEMGAPERHDVLLLGRDGTSRLFATHGPKA